MRSGTFVHCPSARFLSRSSLAGVALAVALAAGVAPGSPREGRGADETAGEIASEAHDEAHDEANDEAHDEANDEAAVTQVAGEGADTATAGGDASGAAPENGPVTVRPIPTKLARHASHWAYQPIARPEPPAPRDTAWPRNDLDRFVLAELEANGLAPAPEADRRTLLRRAYLDLVGVPPTLDEVESFVADRAPDAYERRLEALLASPMYGERWGRHWLDVARYADSNGVDENIAYANAFRYRDWVISAFNDDIPFDEFLVDQIAGDLVPEPANPTADDDARTRGRIAALGFLALGPKMLAEPDKEKERVDVVDEQIDIVTKAFLGQTLSCARCHDHKFDPVSAADYFAIAGVFRSVSTFDNIATVGRVAQRPLATAAEIARMEAWRAEAGELDRARDEARSARDAARTARNAARLAAALERAAADDAGPTPAPFAAAMRAAIAAGPSPETRALDAAIAARRAHEATRPADFPRALAVREALRDGKPDETPIHDRGDHMSPTGAPIARGVPTVLEAALPGPVFPADASGRLELARWMADGENPLTARVAVNRIWTWHFGTGLVDTPSNFGVIGSKPSHPELLDWLARRFVADGWSVKAMHRLVMTSATYRQASAVAEPLPSTDPDNRLLSRFPRRRIEAEAIRDSVLATAGTLDREMGGSLLTAGDHAYVTNDQSGNAAKYDSNRRSIYLPVIRNAMFGLFTAFDYPDSSAPIDCRPRTVVAPQALFFMNAPFVEEAAATLADRLAASRALTADRIEDAFRLVLARAPHDDETARATRFVMELEVNGMPPRDALVRLCHALLSTNEFVTME
ncbi:MAG: hypothetical protein RI967_556 [Planctomycetota bacterium]